MVTRGKEQYFRVIRERKGREEDRFRYTKTGKGSRKIGSQTTRRHDRNEKHLGRQ